MEDVENINRKVQNHRRDRQRVMVGKWVKGLEGLLMETESYMMLIFWNYLVRVTGYAHTQRTLWLST